MTASVLQLEGGSVGNRPSSLEELVEFGYGGSKMKLEAGVGEQCS